MGDAAAAGEGSEQSAGVNAAPDVNGTPMETDAQPTELKVILRGPIAKILLDCYSSIYVSSGHF